MNQIFSWRKSRTFTFRRPNNKNCTDLSFTQSVNLRESVCTDKSLRNIVTYVANIKRKYFYSLLHQSDKL